MPLLATNRDRIVEQSVLGEVVAPSTRRGAHWRVGPDGVPRALPPQGRQKRRTVKPASYFLLGPINSL